MARRCHHDVLLPRNRYTGSEAAEIVVLNIFQRADESGERITVPPNSVDVQELLGLGVHQSVWCAAAGMTTVLAQ